MSMHAGLLMTTWQSGKVAALSWRPALKGAAWLALLTLTTLTCGTPAGAVDADVLLRGGTIYDGSGSEGVVADIAIAGDKIVAIGRIEPGKVGRTIDCRGLVIAPGFIDLHTHSDRAIGQKAAAALNYLRQGCTTMVTGNCGGGPVEIGKFLAKVETTGAGANIIHLVPHGSVRQAVMGTAKRAPSEAELEKMKALVDRGMREGAWGISTGLIYVPSTYAETDELVALAAVAARHGGIYATHLRNEGDNLLPSIREALEIGRRANIQVQLSHFKLAGKGNWGHIGRAVAEVEKARSEGVRVFADQYPYTASSTSLQSTLVSAAKITGGSKDLFKRMESDAELDKLVRDEIRQKIDRSAKIVIAACKKYPQFVGKDLREIAAQEKSDVVEVAVKILRDGGATAVNHAMSEQDVREAMQVSWVATGSDGSARLPDRSEAPHPRNFGTFARKIGYYALEQKVLPLAQAIRSCSGLPADVLGLADRGYLRPGCFADVVVLDPKTYLDRATFEDSQQYASGVRYLLVAGHLAWDDSQPSEKLFGRALRHVDRVEVN